MLDDDGVAVFRIGQCSAGGFDDLPQVDRLEVVVGDVGTGAEVGHDGADAMDRFTAVLEQFYEGSLGERPACLQRHHAFAISFRRAEAVVEKLEVGGQQRNGIIDFVRNTAREPPEIRKAFGLSSPFCLFLARRVRGRGLRKRGPHTLTFDGELDAAQRCAALKAVVEQHVLCAQAKGLAMERKIIDPRQDDDRKVRRVLAKGRDELEALLTDRLDQGTVERTRDGCGEGFLLSDAVDPRKVLCQSEPRFTRRGWTLLMGSYEQQL